METEIWKNVVIDGKVYGGYSVSNLGNVVSHRRQLRDFFGKRTSTVVIDPNHKSKMIPTAVCGGYQKLTLTFPKEFNDTDIQYRSRTNGKTYRKDFFVHQLVIWAFMPFEENPPERLRPYWNEIPDEVKSYIKECIHVHHKNHKTYDNKILNLMYVTPRENTAFYEEERKLKKDEDACIEIIPPRYLPLFQEYDDGQIIFKGKEGEKLYEKIKKLANDKNKSSEEILFDLISNDYFYNFPSDFKEKFPGVYKCYCKNLLP